MTEDQPEFEQEAATALGSADWRVRRRAVHQLVKRPLSDRELSELLDVMRESHRDFGRLNAAIQVLVQTGADVVPPLVAMLESPDVDLRCYAALALGEREDPRAAESLIRLLDDPDANVVLHAVDALGRLRAAAAVEALSKFVVAGEFSLKFAAVVALGSIGDMRVVPSLLSLLEDPLLQSPAIEALATLGNRDIVASIVVLLEASDAPAGTIAHALNRIVELEETRFQTGDEVRRRIREAVSERGKRTLLAACDDANSPDLREIVQLLGDLQVSEDVDKIIQLVDRAELRDAVFHFFVGHGETGFAALVRRLPMLDSEAQQDICRFLGRERVTAALKPLLDLLQEDDADVAIAAADSLGDIGDDDALFGLISLFGHAQQGVRHAAAAAVRRIAEAAQVTALVLPLLRHQSPLVRESALKSLAGNADAATVGAILACCDDPDLRVSLAAIERLPIKTNSLARERVLQAVRSDRPNVRAGALVKLAEDWSEETKSCLKSALCDPDLWVRYVALRELLQRQSDCVSLDMLVEYAAQSESVPIRATAIRELGRRSKALSMIAGYVDDLEFDVAAAAIGAIGAAGDEQMVATLARLLDDQDPRRRMAAVRALMECPNPSAVPLLTHAAFDTVPTIATEAIKALGRLGSASAVKGLLTISLSPSRRDECTGALTVLGPTTVDFLARGLLDPNVDIRRTAVEVLTRIGTPAAVDALTTALNDIHPSVRFAVRYVCRRLRPNLPLAHDAASDRFEGAL